MSDQVIVIQTEDAEDAGIQVSYFNTLEEATRHIEGCLEAGCRQDNISAYRATRLKLQVTHRPVASLTADNGAPIPPEGAPDVQEETADSETLPRLPSSYYTPRPA
jgi:hypothetical protein